MGVSRCFLVGWESCLFLPRVKPHFCGACTTISYHCLGLCLLSSCFFGCGPGEAQGSVWLCGFRSCILSHGIPDRSPYIHTFCRPPLPPLSILLPFLFASEGSIPQNHWLPQIHKVSCSSQCIRTVMFHMYILKVAMYSRIRHQPFQKLNQNMIAVIRSIIWSKTHI